MIILGFRKVSPLKYTATITHDGVGHELSIVVHLESDIQSFNLEGASRPLQQLIHNSGYSRPFSYHFWQFYAGRPLSFPIDLNPGTERRAARA
jgi:hypothetical protein